jgi:hypothetical protein
VRILPVEVRFLQVGFGCGEDPTGRHPYEGKRRCLVGSYGKVFYAAF